MFEMRNSSKEQKMSAQGTLNDLFIKKKCGGSLVK